MDAVLGSYSVPNGSIPGDVSDSSPNDFAPAAIYTVSLGRSGGVDDNDEIEDDEDAPWFDHVKANFEGTDLDRCFERHGVPPEDGCRGLRLVGWLVA